MLPRGFLVMRANLATDVLFRLVWLVSEAELWLVASIIAIAEGRRKNSKEF